MILHTVTCAVYQPQFKADEQCTMHITRRYRLTFAGVKRVIAREHHGARVMSVNYAEYAKH